MYGPIKNDNELFDTTIIEIFQESYIDNDLDWQWQSLFRTLKSSDYNEEILLTLWPLELLWYINFEVATEYVIQNF